MIKWFKSLMWLVRNLPMAVEIIRTIRKDLGNVYTRINTVRR